MGIGRSPVGIAVPLLFLLLLSSACATTPLPKTLSLDRPPRLGILGFKVTAPVKRLSSIAQAPKGISKEEKNALLKETLQGIEDKATEELVATLQQQGTILPVLIPEGLLGTCPGERPSPSQIEMLREELGLDAIIYGEIPWYGKTRLLYPILGETIDISVETILIGVASRWNLGLMIGNIGLELLTSTPLWFGGFYLFGLAFRPVSIEAWVLSTEDGREIWHESVEIIMSRKILKTYPEADRSKKGIQLEASMRKAIAKLSESLSK